MPDEGSPLARLAAALRTSDSFKARTTAAVALGRLGDQRATGTLADALRSDEHYAVRVAAASALGRLASKEAIQPLLAALQDQDPLVRDAIQNALQHFHTVDHVASFKEALTSNEVSTRLAGVNAFAAVINKDPEAGGLILTALGDDHEPVRARAVKAIDSMPRDRAVNLVLEGLQNGGSDVRGACAQLASRFVDPRAIEPLVALLTSTDDSADARAAARVALKAHASFLDRAALHAAARDVVAERRDARVRAVRVLVALDDALALSLVDQALHDPDAIVRVGGGRAAADLQNGRGRSALENAMVREEDPRTRKQLELILKSMR